MTLACSDRQGHIILVLKRKKGKTFFIGKPRNKRTTVSLFNREFNNTYLLIADSPETIASKWLASPIPMTNRVKEELQMIVGLKNNKIVGKYNDEAEAAEGVELVAGIEDLSGRSLKSLNALHKKLTGDDTKFANVEEASAAVWACFADFEVPVKEKKEKVERQKIELIELPKSIGKQSVITEIKENTKRVGSSSFDRYELYSEGMTVAEFCAAGGTMADVRFDGAHGHISIEFVEEAPVEKPAKKSKKAAATEE